jgi:hypothetical protein
MSRERMRQRIEIAVIGFCFSSGRLERFDFAA